MAKREILLLFTPTKEMNSGLGGDRAKRANIQAMPANFFWLIGVSFFIQGEPVFSNTTRLYPKISEDVPNNSKVPKKIIMLHMDLHKSEILGKVSSFTHYSWIFSFLKLYCFFFKLTYFWKVSTSFPWLFPGNEVGKVCQFFFPRSEKLVRKREIEVFSPRA